MIQPPDTGHFVKSRRIRHAMLNEHTLCGRAFDLDSDEDVGRWVFDDEPMPITCPDCIERVRCVILTRIR